MPRRLATIALLALAPMAAAAATEDALTSGAGSGVPPARDGNIAIAQELEAARRAGTAEAYDLFIARHPAHPLSAIARRERQAIMAGKARR